MQSDTQFLKLQEWARERGFSFTSNSNEGDTEIPTTNTEINDIVSKPAHLASAEGNEEILNILLKNYNAKADSETPMGWTPLHCNAAFSKPNIGELLLKYNANIEAQTTKEKETPLFKAIVHNNEEMVKFLLENKANPNVKIIQNLTPLHASAMSSDPITRLLLEYGANVDCVDESGITPLHSCSSSSKKIELILKNSLNPKKTLEAKDFNNQNTPLHTSIVCDKEINGMKTLLQNGANIEAKARFDLTPLHVATEYHKEMKIKYLLENNANLEGLDQAKETPIFRAVMNNNPNILKLLLDHHASIDVVNIYGDTPLTKAAKDCRRLSIDKEIFDVLINYGKANINHISKSSCGFTTFTALHCLTTYGKFEIVNLLMNAKHQKLDVNIPDKNGDTPLHLTATYDAKNVSQMIQNHMNQTMNPPSSSTSSTSSSSSSSSMSNHSKIASVLLNHGANVNAINRAGMNPLNLALGVLKRIPK